MRGARHGAARARRAWKQRLLNLALPRSEKATLPSSPRHIGSAIARVTTVTLRVLATRSAGHRPAASASEK